MFKRSRRRGKEATYAKTVVTEVTEVEDTSKPKGQVGEWSRAEMDADGTMKPREGELEGHPVLELRRYELE